MKLLFSLLLLCPFTARAGDAPVSYSEIKLERNESRELYGKLGFRPGKSSVKSIVCVCHDCLPDSFAEGDALRLHSDECWSYQGNGKYLRWNKDVGAMFDG